MFPCGRERPGVHEGESQGQAASPGALGNRISHHHALLHLPVLAEVLLQPLWGGRTTATGSKRARASVLASTHFTRTLERIRNFHVWWGNNRNHPEVLVPPDPGLFLTPQEWEKGFTLCCLPAESANEHFTAKIENKWSGWENSAPSTQRFLDSAQRCGKRCVTLQAVLENKVFCSYQGSWGESTADRLLWLPSVSILCPGGVNAWGACPSRVERSRVRECGRTDAEWAELGGFGPGWHRRAGQIQPGTDSSSSSVPGPSSHRRTTLPWSQAASKTPRWFRFGLSK